ERMDSYDKHAVKQALVALSRELQAVIQDIDHIALDLEGSKINHEKGQSLTTERSRDAQDSLHHLTSKLLDIQASANRSFASSVACASEHFNRHAEISCLPVEVLSGILTTYVESEMDVDHELNDDSRKHMILPYSWINIIAVCRGWTRLINNTPAIWTFIDLSWPQARIQRHVALSKDAPYRISWDVNRRLKMPDVDYLTKDKHPVVSLKIRDMYHESSDSVQSYFLGFWNPWILTQPIHLELLHIVLGRSYHRPDTRFALPPMPNLKHIRLLNCYTTSHIAPSLRTIHFEATSRDFTYEHILRILSGCPLLTSVFFKMDLYKTDAENSSEEFTPSQDIIPGPISAPRCPMVLPHLRELSLQSLSLRETECILDNIIIEALPSFSAWYTAPQHLPNSSSFFIPKPLQVYASPAKTLEVRGSLFRYSKDDEYLHEFSFDRPYRDYGSEYVSAIASITHYFTSIEHLAIDPYKARDNAAWIKAFPVFDRLKELSLWGLQRELLEILRALAETEPLLCPNLRVLALRNSGGIFFGEPRLVSGGGRVISEEEKRTGNLLQFAADQLELLLTRRDQLGVRIQKLILPEASSWDSRNEKWTLHVDTVVIERGAGPGPGGSYDSDEEEEEEEDSDEYDD
ncbi:hypothetical protein SISNIDRAFT_451153, partial [Sistotremastrum niveocremeum HHB9708]